MIEYFNPPERTTVAADSVLEAMYATFTAPEPRITGNILHYWWKGPDCLVAYKQRTAVSGEEYAKVTLHFATVTQLGDEVWQIDLERTITENKP